MSIETAKELLDSIVQFNKVKNGPSGDAEHDAGVEMQDAAIAHLRAGNGTVALAELVDSYGDTLDNDVEDDSDGPDASIEQDGNKVRLVTFDGPGEWEEFATAQEAKDWGAQLLASYLAQEEDES